MSPLLKLVYFNHSHMILQVADAPKLNVKGAMMNEQAFRGIRDCFTKTYKEAGIRGLYRGVGMNS